MVAVNNHHQNVANTGNAQQIQANNFGAKSTGVSGDKRMSMNGSIFTQSPQKSATAGRQQTDPSKMNDQKATLAKGKQMAADGLSQAGSQKTSNAGLKADTQTVMGHGNDAQGFTREAAQGTKELQQETTQFTKLQQQSAKHSADTQKQLKGINAQQATKMGEIDALQTEMQSLQGTGTTSLQLGGVQDASGDKKAQITSLGAKLDSLGADNTSLADTTKSLQKTNISYSKSTQSNFAKFTNNVQRIGTYQTSNIKKTSMYTAAAASNMDKASGTQTAGQVLTGVGSGVTAIGTLLSNFFGAGAPIAAAGGVITTAGCITSSAGASAKGDTQGAMAYMNQAANSASSSASAAISAAKDIKAGTKADAATNKQTDTNFKKTEQSNQLLATGTDDLKSNLNNQGGAYGMA